MPYPDNPYASELMVGLEQKYQNAQEEHEILARAHEQAEDELEVALGPDVPLTVGVWQSIDMARVRDCTDKEIRTREAANAAYERRISAYQNRNHEHWNIAIRRHEAAKAEKEEKEAWERKLKERAEKAEEEKKDLKKYDAELEKEMREAFEEWEELRLLDRRVSEEPAKKIKRTGKAKKAAPKKKPAAKKVATTKKPGAKRETKPRASKPKPQVVKGRQPTMKREQQTIAVDDDDEDWFGERDYSFY